jgi:hypothetical protein
MAALAQRACRLRGAGLRSRHQDPQRSISSKKSGAGARLDVMAGVGAECRRIGAAALPENLNGIAAVNRCDQAVKADGVTLDLGMAGDRRTTRAAKRGEKGALGGKRGRGIGIIDRGGKCADLIVIGARLERDCTLACRR